MQELLIAFDFMFYKFNLISDGNIRLVDGSSPYDGRLEICLGGIWGTVCDYEFTDSAAIVACRSLGHR
jgi:Scavenger receptor cysteine-rich domain